MQAINPQSPSSGFRTHDDRAVDLDALFEDEDLTVHGANWITPSDIGLGANARQQTAA